MYLATIFNQTFAYSLTRGRDMFEQDGKISPKFDANNLFQSLK